ncbi:hypothetical protein NIES4071_12310 [Calothrix sp. NIES-4071]|nr:hypothetical protein NIES4071_12310 [Calothrix sp. NIES-4071]BAZ55571.1 hypothetical protein NIES4105_12270 [Calothrix sp. NIES-4105]
MYNYLESSHDVSKTAPINRKFEFIHKLIACFLVIGCGIILGLLLVFLPAILIVKLANRQSDKAKIKKTYNSLIERYYNNTLFQVRSHR